MNECSVLEKKKYNIVHLTLRMGPGGLEQLIVAMCKYGLKKNNKTSIIVLEEFDSKTVSKLEQNGISVIQYNKKIGFYLNYYLQLGRILRKNKTQIIHAHSGCLHDGGLFSLFSGKVKLILTCHGLPVEKGYISLIKDNIAGLFAKKVVAVSEEVALIYRKRLLFGKSKINLITNGIDIKKFRPPSIEEKKNLKLKFGISPEIKIIGSVGRLVEIKNHELLIKAFSKIVNSKMNLIIIGEGELYVYLKQLAEKLQIEKYIHFLGVQYSMEKVYPLMDVFVLPSLTEGTSIALLEAQACGTPSVVTNVGGNPFVVIDNYNGFVVPVNDDLALSTAIKHALIPEVSKKFSKNSRKRVEKFYSLEKMMHEYGLLYDN
jgi:glycosyltransferase involved in cell wall biosynthesis